MISILIDTRSISEQFELSQSEIDNMMDFVVKEITHRFADEWTNEANRTLKSSRQEYISNLNVVDEGFAKGAVVLTGWLPNAVEQGLDAYDMKLGLLNGPNSRPTKSGGRMNVVPFTFGTPGALEENFSNILPQSVYEAIKSKPQNVVLPGGGMSTRPLKEEEVPQAFREPQKKSVKLPQAKNAKEYQHKSSIYVGVRRVQDNVTGQNRYTSFRAVSDNSDPNSWLHPGINESDLATKTLERFDIPSEAGRAIDNWFNQR